MSHESLSDQIAEGEQFAQEVKRTQGAVGAFKSRIVELEALLGSEQASHNDTRHTLDVCRQDYEAEKHVAEALAIRVADLKSELDDTVHRANLKAEKIFELQQQVDAANARIEQLEKSLENLSGGG